MAIDIDKTPERLIDDLLMEADAERSQRETIWDRSLNRYGGRHWDKQAPPGRKQFTVNRTQAAIINAAHIQTENVQRPKLSPVEIEDPPLVFLTASGALKMQALTGKPTDANTQVPEEQLVQMVQAGLLPEDYLLVNDQLASESMQTMIDMLMDRGNFDFAWIDCIINKGVIGHQAMLVQWDDSLKKVRFINEHPKNLWIDPLASGIEDASYCAVAEVMPVERAVIRFPKYADEIRKAGSEGPKREIERGLLSGTLGDKYDNTDFKRNMVVLWTLWIRDTLYPIDEQELIEDGLIVAESREEQGKDGMPIGMRVAYINSKGQEITPSSAAWPKRSGIRQIQMVGATTVYDAECKYADIPVAWNINMPDPFCPYGIGEAERLEDLNQFINRQFSNVHDHYKYFSAPQQIIAQSVLNALGDKADGWFSAPNRVIPVDDDTMAMGGKPVQIVDPPTFSPSAIDALVLAINEFKELSGMTDVNVGRPHSGAESGVAIQSLQAAARGPMGIRMHYTRKAMVYVARLLVGIAKDFLSEQDWSRVLSQYPPEVLRVIRSRAKMLDFDVRVDIADPLVDKQANAQEARADFQMGVETLEGLMERLGRPNPKAKAREIRQQSIQSAPVAGVQQSPAASPQAAG